MKDKKSRNKKLITYLDYHLLRDKMARDQRNKEVHKVNLVV